MQLTLLPSSYNIYRFSTATALLKILPTMVNEHFFSITGTRDEVSLVCMDSISLTAEKAEKGWKVIKIVGPLDFSMTGVLAKISKLIAAIDVSIFVISTFDTDYILVKKEQIGKVVATLESHHYFFKSMDNLE